MNNEGRLKAILAKPAETLTPEEIALMSLRDQAIRGLAYDPTIYDKEWLGHQAWQHPWCQKLMGWFVGEHGPFETSLDLGAGDGGYSYVMGEMGTDAWAIEVSSDATDIMHESVQCAIHDLREPLHLGRQFELIICLEVAEHLPESAADTLCDTIGKHASKLLLFSSAPPGQGGHGHINLQPFEYWQSRLETRGLVYNHDETMRLRQAWSNILGESMPWLQSNGAMFRKG